MKRIVVLIDGTWNKEGITGNTNVATLDPGNRIVANAFIRAVAVGVHYHDGVGLRYQEGYLIALSRAAGKGACDRGFAGGSVLHHGGACAASRGPHFRPHLAEAREGED